MQKKLQKTPEEYAERAKSFFAEGYNCSQAVLLTFAEELGMPLHMAAKLASSFGGGMGRLREVCGAVSGMFMAAGLLEGYDDPKDHAEKTAHYKRIQELAEAFRRQNGSIVCRELLGLAQTGASHHEPEKRTEAYYKKRPCQELVGDAAKLFAAYFSAQSYNK
ncbi:MAG: C_GCAxxG_C_C family protein [Ruminococcus sp.]|nr:C_GCAxxG_C_C family protein [Ruminococcus sp.]